MADFLDFEASSHWPRIPIGTGKAPWHYISRIDGWSVVGDLPDVGRAARRWLRRGIDFRHQATTRAPKRRLPTALPAAAHFSSDPRCFCRSHRPGTRIEELSTARRLHQSNEPNRDLKPAPALLCGALASGAAEPTRARQSLRLRRDGLRSFQNFDLLLRFIANFLKARFQHPVRADLFAP